MKITQILNNGELSKTYFYILLRYSELTNFNEYYNEMTQLLLKTAKEKLRVSPIILQNRIKRLTDFENTLKTFATLPEPTDSEDLFLQSTINRKKRQYVKFVNQKTKLGLCHTTTRSENLNTLAMDYSR